ESNREWGRVRVCLPGATLVASIARGRCWLVMRSLPAPTSVEQIAAREFARLFDPSYARSSFQNKLLVYMLYKCGAFIPSSKKEKVITAPASRPETGAQGLRRETWFCRVRLFLR